MHLNKNYEIEYKKKCKYLIDFVSNCHGLKEDLMLLQLFKLPCVDIKALANLFPNELLIFLLSK